MTFSELRKKKCFTQQLLAERLGVEQPTVAMWETGKSVPAMKNLLKLSEVLDISVSDLVNSFSKNKKAENSALEKGMHDVSNTEGG